MDLKQYRSKLIGSKDERAVSPVIGVILMVAITVILAAVIAAFVLDMGSGVESDVQAGATVDSDSTRDTITTSFTTRQSDSTVLEVTYTGNSGTDVGTIVLDEPGSTVTVGNATDGSENSITGGSWGTDPSSSAVTNDGDVITVSVVAVDGDKSTQIMSKEVEL